MIFLGIIKKKKIDFFLSKKNLKLKRGTKIYSEDIDIKRDDVE